MNAICPTPTAGLPGEKERFSLIFMSGLIRGGNPCACLNLCQGTAARFYAGVYQGAGRMPVQAAIYLGVDFHFRTAFSGIFLRKPLGKLPDHVWAGSHASGLHLGEVVCQMNDFCRSGLWVFGYKAGWPDLLRSIIRQDMRCPSSVQLTGPSNR